MLTYAAGRGAIVAEFTEIESGRRNDRPELHQALELCRRRRAVLVIAKLDRLARNVAFIANLMDAGAEFVAVDMPQANRLTLHILAAVAEHEREMISQRTRAALQAAGVGMSDKAVAMTREEWRLDPHLTDCQGEQDRMDALKDTEFPPQPPTQALRETFALYRAVRDTASAGQQSEQRCRCGETPLANPSPVMPERGERRPLRPVTQGESDVIRKALLASSTVVAPGRLRTGNALADERGVTHGHDSPVAREFGRPVDPTIEAGDPA